MFWGLGFRNAWRNFSRSALAFLSIALAAGFMTRALFVQGYTLAKDEGYRSINGGAISAYALSLSAESLSGEGGRQYNPYLSNIEDTDLALMMPELLREGYISAPERPAPFGAAEIAALESLPFLQAVYPRYQMPAFSHSQNGSRSTPLRGRDLALDSLGSLADYIGDGRWFTETDQGQMVAVVHSNQNARPEERKIGVGDRLQISLPRITQHQGTTRYDVADPLLFELTVIGVLDVPMRHAIQYGLETHWVHQLYAMHDEIELPLQTWQQLWQLAGGGEYRPQQLALMVEDLSDLENTVRSLQQELPQYSFFSVSSLLRRTEGNFLLENSEKVLFHEPFTEQLLLGTESEQMVLSNDLRLPIIALMFANAALIIAANLLILISERRREIGILKAVGARRLEIVQMILAEALLVSLLGCLAGFVLARFSGVLTQLTNRISFASIAITLGSELLQVLSLAGVATLLFSLLPALLTANLSVREVLQDE